MCLLSDGGGRSEVGQAWVLFTVTAVVSEGIFANLLFFSIALIYDPGATYSSAEQVATEISRVDVVRFEDLFF